MPLWFPGEEVTIIYPSKPGCAVMLVTMTILIVRLGSSITEGALTDKFHSATDVEQEGCRAPPRRYEDYHIVNVKAQLKNRMIHVTPTYVVTPRTWESDVGICGLCQLSSASRAETRCSSGVPSLW
jgi:hypothetical protein